MARVKIDLPAQFSFSTTIKVRVTDLNYGGHVGNDTILGLFHESRLQFLNHLGYANEVNSIEGIGLIQADAAVVYKSETFYGETLLVEVAAEDFNKFGFDFVYKISKEGGQEVARGKTGIVCFNYETRKLALLPESFRKNLET